MPGTTDACISVSTLRIRTYATATRAKTLLVLVHDAGICVRFPAKTAVRPACSVFSGTPSEPPPQRTRAERHESPRYVPTCGRASTSACVDASRLRRQRMDEGLCRSHYRRPYGPISHARHDTPPSRRHWTLPTFCDVQAGGAAGDLANSGTVLVRALHVRSSQNAFVASSADIVLPLNPRWAVQRGVVVTGQ
ncbi:hypothetical protein PsYK624_162880 [Phanerochaete sordida]|uniref:Uncharacterized protein n=1 Tax=Phanerochaete sordida TaxID=48140 RepID=A0A9P3GQN9_9APHY|nr:hypothetical protein PsYK624_162880 [Phanerochaete sordida]